MESFGELDPSNQTGISAKSCRLKSVADNPFKNTSAEVPLYIDCLCIPDVIPALHENHVDNNIMMEAYRQNNHFQAGV